jgi:hypothetical protein
LITLSVVTCTHIAAEAPSADKFASAVLATARGVLGPLTDALKLIKPAVADYSVMTGEATVFDHRETRTTVFYSNGVATSTVMETRRHYIDPADGKTSRFETFVTTTDAHGTKTAPPINDSFYHTPGYAKWKCESRNANGTLSGQSKYATVFPTRFRILVTPTKYSEYGFKYPSIVTIALAGAVEYVAPTCRSMSPPPGQLWQTTTAFPGTAKYVDYRLSGTIMDNTLPSIEIGYLK